MLVRVKVCSSSLVSAEWISSLFNAEITRMTPLDFRLVAAAVFRLLAFQCSSQAAAVRDVSGNSLNEQRVRALLTSRDSLSDQTDAVLKNIRAELQVQPGSTDTGDFFMFVVRLSRVYSALRTNAFILSEPGSTQYQVFEASYPLQTNLSYTDVSKFDIINSTFQFYEEEPLSLDPLAVGRIRRISLVETPRYPYGLE